MNRIRLLMLILALVSLSACTTGCGSEKIVLVQPGIPLRLAEPVNAYVYVPVDGVWVKSDNRVEIPLGYWVIQDPDKVLNHPARRGVD